MTQRGSAATEVLTTDPPTPRLRRDRLDGWHGWFPSRKELNRTDGPRNTRRTRTKQISSPKLSSLFAACRPWRVFSGQNKLFLEGRKSSQDGWFPSRKELNRTDGPRNTRRTRTKQMSSPKLSSLFAYLVGKISYSWRAENLRKTRRISPIALRIHTDVKKMTKPE